MIENFLDVTAKAKAGQTAGHGRWFHSTLLSAGDKYSKVAVGIVSKSEKIEHCFNLLSYHQDRINLSYFLPLPFAALDARKIELMLSECNIEKPNFHFYEGGFREFLLAILLINKNPDSVAVFNFNLAEPWNELLKNQGFLAKTIQKSFRILASWAGSRIFYFSESNRMQELLRTSLEIESEPYPLFSCVAEDNRKAESGRDNHITYFPFNSEELDFCLSVHAKVTSETPEAKGRIVMRWGGQIDSSKREKIQDLKLDCISNIVSEKEYQDIYLKTKISFLPYFGEYYTYSSSGRLLDAIQGGSWVMAPKGSAPADFLLRHGLGRDFTNDPIAAAKQALRLIQKNSSEKPHMDVTVDKSFRVLSEAFTRLRENDYSALGSVPKLSLWICGLAIFGTSTSHIISVLMQSVLTKQVVRMISTSRKKARTE